MRRREFLVGCLFACAAEPVSSQPAPMHRIAFIHSAFPAGNLTETTGPFWIREFFNQLRRLGYAEGQNLSVARYSAEGDRERHPKLAAEIAASNPSLIIANSNLLVDALRKATETIPIIGILADPVSYGTVTNLARPQGNITGVSIDAGIQVNGKRLALLKQAAPAVYRVGFLTPPADWEGAGGDEVRRAANALGVGVVGASPDSGAGTIRKTLERLLASGANGLLVSASGEWVPHREIIVRSAREFRLPAMYPYRDFVEVGGLMAYSPDLRETATHLADAVAQVLRGKHPSEIPIQQATKFDLILNPAAAREIGLILPTGIQGQADEVIE